MQLRRHLPCAIYPITHLAVAGASSHAALVRALLDGGARWLQLRDKTRTTGELIGDFRRACREACRRRARVVVNDRVDLALAAGAAGVHLGEEDLPAEAARRLLGPRAIVGMSTHSARAAEHAARLPVDYVALGPIFPSPSKPGAHAVLGLEPLREARVRVAAPLVAIGGIGPGKVAEVLRAGADAVALISGVFDAREGATARMRQLLRESRRVLAERCLRGRHLYLVGFMGAGKSTVGPTVAAALGRPFVDLDSEVEKDAESSIADLFGSHGEAHFRALERRMLTRLSRGRDAVIALGGGALGEAVSRRRVQRTGVSVWLDAPLEILRRRCRAPGAPQRPLVRDEGQVRRLYRLRRPLYAMADHRISTADKEPDRVGERILAWLRRRGE